ncbi:hypothetical protein ACFC8N_42665 [Streptomyces sp. NPDC055966]|uniref:hypothetical protein n=1 Tax=Streptomyces sp. NPDC055966 TaxID=3345669 RepID=UPI0035DD24DE
MDLNRTPAQIADAAAEEVRALCHVTHPFKADWTQPAQISDTAHNVALIVDRLPQALKQLGAGLRMLEEKGAVRTDDGTDVAKRVGAALRALLNAQQALTVIQGALREATGSLSHLGGYLPDGEDEAEV